MVGIETLDYAFAGTHAVGDAFAPVIVGVVASGNLEVLVEPAAAGDAALCRFHVETSAQGFGAIWEAVLRAFQERHGLRGVSVSINDMGATPAVVSLRLDQAAAALPGGAP